MTTQPALKNIVEAALLAAGRVVTVRDLQALFAEQECPDRKALLATVEALQTEYQGRGMELVEVAGGYRIQARACYAAWIARLWQERPSRYSRALMESLALIAYRQPMTRGEIEEVRGVSVSTQIVRTLLDRKWIRVLGHKDVPGRPALYGTTTDFLEYFNLKSLAELPSLAAIRDLEHLPIELGVSKQEPHVKVQTQNEETQAGGTLTTPEKRTQNEFPAAQEQRERSTYLDSSATEEQERETCSAA